MSHVLPDEVMAIVAMDDRPELRNLRITQAYHELTLALREWIGDANIAWSGFACWASKQAGTFIRHEELPAVLRRALDPNDARLDVIEQIVDGVAAHVMLGNKLVFAEMGDVFARFLVMFAGDAKPDAAKLASFLSSFAEGSSQPDELSWDAEGQLTHTQRGGCSVLRSAMEHLYAARFEAAPKARAERVLMCNALCGLHEQTRLQPYIRGAQQAPIVTLLERGGLEHAASSSVDAIAQRFRDLTTELVMTLPLPGQTLHLGRDLDAPPGEPLWPAALEQLERAELVALTETLGTYAARERNLDWSDRVEDWLDHVLVAVGIGTLEAQGTGARDWSVLSQRMRFIFELFRSRQQHAALFQPPFSAAQLDAIRRGNVPDGPL